MDRFIDRAIALSVLLIAVSCVSISVALAINLLR